MRLSYFYFNWYVISFLWAVYLTDSSSGMLIDSNPSIICVVVGVERVLL